MIFRLSQKLATKIKENKLPVVSLDENPYADWSAHLFTVDRTQYIIVANTKSFYSVVMYGKGITDGSIFIDHALSALREFMEYDGQGFVYQRLIAPTASSVKFAKALDRSTVGSINELVKFATYYLQDDEISPFDIGFKLNGILLSALAPDKKGGCGKPKEAFIRLCPWCGDKDLRQGGSGNQRQHIIPQANPIRYALCRGHRSLSQSQVGGLCRPSDQRCWRIGCVVSRNCLHKR